MNDIRVLPVLPIRGGIIFPHSIVNITVSSERGKILVEEAIKQGISELFSVGYKSNEKNEELFKIGTIIKIDNYSKDEKENSIKLVVFGLKRGRIIKFIQEEPYYIAEIEPIDDNEIIDNEMDILMKSVKEAFINLMNKMPIRSEKQIKEILNIKSPSIFSDVLASFLVEGLEEKQKLLETIDVKERLKKIFEIIQNQLEILKVNETIQEKVKEEIEKSQREYFLREQLKVIQKELGISEEQKEIDEIEEKIKLLPDYVQEVAKRELNKLRKLQTISPEYHVVRTYLDWILNLPWNEETEDNLDISHARKVLDEDHYNLEKVKSRILEYLAVKKIKPNAKGAILCFVGPPGVGKTSLGQSIARALNRKFIRISLGGIRDEAEIRGHRRTYVGALPGRIISALRKVKVKNPVIVLDEVDKIGVDFRGDPASALLEVLDPEQNKEFVDHYLEIPFDLSKVLFITTANTTMTIPPALLDRMEVIEIPGYTLEEKIKIAKFYLIPREIENHGLSNYKIEFEDSAIEEIINKWTREAGVRQLDRKISEILRKIAVQVAEKNIRKNKNFLIKRTNVSKFLGPPLFYSEVAERQNEVGVAIGLAWTPFGGDIIFIEALKMPGKGQLKLTGHLGNVMKESAQAAYSLLRANFEKWKIRDNDFDKYDVHIHVPAGAIPKDGPSAGIAILMALVSLFSNRPIKKFLAMTGEITLRGKILPVGGIKEKVLAARRAGIKEIILPKWNKKDLEDIPKDVLKDLIFHFVDNVQEAYKISFEN